jgi:hypothetical protein
MGTKKHYPIQRKLNVEQLAPATADAYMSVSKLLSQVNHRLYRQSRVYECSVSIDANVADATTVDVYALADTWYLKGALKLAKAAWDASNSEEIAMNGGRVARWNDFRVTPGLTGFQELRAVQFRQATLAQVAFIAGQFNDSQVVDQVGVTRTFSMGDTNPATQFGIIDEYDAQSGTDSDPENPSTSPYNGLLPNQDAAAAQAISEFGSEPPYNANGYQRGVWVKVGTIHLAAGRQRLSTGFFKAPLGLIALRGVGFLSAPDITVEVKGGDYKGVMSHSMLE